jgi:cytidyltransferase-like protein
MPERHLGILHAGHVSYLELARELDGILVVGVNDTETVRDLKRQGSSLTSIEDRVKVLSSIGYGYYPENEPVKVLAVSGDSYILMVGQESLKGSAISYESLNQY